MASKKRTFPDVHSTYSDDSSWVQHGLQWPETAYVDSWQTGRLDDRPWRVKANFAGEKNEPRIVARLVTYTDFTVVPE